MQRAISNYWYWQKINYGTRESFEQAIALEPERMAVENERALRGENSLGHVTFSYMSRGEYATQLRRWFDAVGRDRILILESEQLYADPTTLDRVLEWLGLGPHHQPFPADNGADRRDDMDPELLLQLQRHFEPHNRDLFELLGYELWTDQARTAPRLSHDACCRGRRPVRTRPTTATAAGSAKADGHPRWRGTSPRVAAVAMAAPPQSRAEG